MEEFLNIEDFSKDIEKRRLKKVYEQIIQKSYILIDKVAKKRGVHLLEREEDDTQNFYSIISHFKSTTTYFDDVVFLMEAFLKWDIGKDDPFGSTKDKKIQSYIKLYNKIVSKLNYYEKVEKEIEKKGYNKARKEIENKFIELFEEMMAYKNKEYSENWSFAEWVENVCLYYKDYSYVLKELVEEVYGRGILVNFPTDYEWIQSNDVEKIADMNKLYEDILKELALDNPEYLRKLAAYYCQLATEYKSMKLYNDAESYYKKAKQIIEDTEKDRETLAIFYIDILELYYYMKNYEQAKHYGTMAENLLIDLNNEGLKNYDVCLVRVYKILAKTYLKLNISDKALEYNKKWKSIL